MRDLPVLYICIPCYNEEAMIDISVKMFSEKLNALINSNAVSSQSKLFFINDGSKDETWPMIKRHAETNPLVSGISLSRNRGHQNALLAGLMEAKELCDITISIDCDGQDDVNAMDEMIAAYKDGCDIVYGVRNNRDTDSFFKRFTANSYYKLLKKLGGEIIDNHADYRLVSSRALKEFAKFEEVNIFLRGMFPMVGFKSTCVYYKREKRIAGESHYPLSKMLHLAWDGVTSLSIKPIKIITSLGLTISFFSFLMIIWVLVSYFKFQTVPGWATQVISTCLIGGIQLISIGILGEYIGKIYLETKHRPRFIISERLFKDNQENY
jgi:glycosyltransferase involved in cell wall biosynthesis